MKRKDLILHLLGEISSYILEENPRKDGLHLSFMDDNDHSDDELVRLKKLLNSPKRPELAGYYGAMTGHDMLGSTHLDLLGWQVKHADVSRIDKGIKIDLWLGGERFQSEHFTIPNKSK